MGTGPPNPLWIDRGVANIGTLGPLLGAETPANARAKIERYERAHTTPIIINKLHHTQEMMMHSNARGVCYHPPTTYTPIHRRTHTRTKQG